MVIVEERLRQLSAGLSILAKSQSDLERLTHGLKITLMRETGTALSH